MTYPDFPELSRALSLKAKETTIDPTLRDTMENGMETTRAKFTRRRRQWSVTFDFCTAEDKVALDEFVLRKAVYGSQIFHFNDAYSDPANPVVLNVRFSQIPSYGDFVLIGGVLAQPCTFELREV